MRRFALAFVVALLTFSASGVSGLFIAEPCTGYEQPGREDRACPPTCVTCGCCVQPAEPVALPAIIALDTRVTDIDPLVPTETKTTPRDILHVPKAQLA